MMNQKDTGSVYPCEDSASQEPRRRAVDCYINNQDYNWPIITNNILTTGKVKGGVLEPTQRLFVYLHVQYTRWTFRIRAKRDIFY